MGNILASGRQFSYTDFPLYSPKVQDILACRRLSNADDVPSSSESQCQIHIRVLQLQPPKSLPWWLTWLPNSLHKRFIPLHGTLDIICLGQKDQPQYKALSYTWGPPVFTGKILISGRKFAITLYLDEALRHLRPYTTPLTIWIDQICINQMDTDEKSKQVAGMSKIYESAEEGIVWLGPQADGSDRLIEILLRMGDFALVFGLPNYYTRTRISELIRICANDNPEDPATIQYHVFCDEVLPLFTCEVLKSVIALQKRAWFQRTWVLQEYTLPPEVTLVCGNQRIKAEILMVVLLMIGKTISEKLIFSTQAPDVAILIDEMKKLSALGPFTSSRQRRKAMKEGRYSGDSLYQLLQRAHINNGTSLQATNPRDKIYGLLGLACDEEELKEQGFEPNYKEMPELVFTKAARALIQSNGVDALLFAQHYKGNTNLLLPAIWKLLNGTLELPKPFKQVQNLVSGHPRKTEETKTQNPSWAPDWREKIQLSFAWLRDETSNPIFSASRGMVFESKARHMDHMSKEELQVLTLRGYRVDSIEQVGDVWEGARAKPRTYMQVLSSNSWWCPPRDRDAGRPFPSQRYLDYLEQVRQMCQLANEKPTSIYSTELRRLEAEWRVPVGDIEQDDSAKASRAKHSWKEAYDKCLAELHLEKELATMRNAEDQKARVAQVFSMSGDSSGYRVRMRELREKRPFISQMGYVGMGPQYMLPGDVIVVLCGDVIVVLCGASLPFIVRPVEGGNFRLLGECYCDGIMDGEIVAARKSDDKMEEIIALI